MLLVLPFAGFVTLPVKDRICLAREEIMGYARKGYLLYGIH